MPERLTVDALLEQARTGSVDDLDPAAAQRMDDSRDGMQAAAMQREVYGRTTGVGANRIVHVAPQQRKEQDLRLLRSHATGSGPLLEQDVLRAMLLARRQQLCAGGSGLGAVVARALTDMLREDELPMVHAHGSLGTGDLNALAEVGLALVGEHPLRGGKLVRRWEPEGGDALPFISSNALTTAQAAFAIEEVERWLDHVAMVTAGSLVAARGSAEPFAREVQDARPQPGQHRVAAAVRAALEGAPLEPARVQDSFGFRAMPQVVGPLRAALDQLRAVVEVELNSAPENPLYDPQLRTALHNGNFHAQALALAADQVAVSLAGAAQLSLARLGDLCDPAMTGTTAAFLPDSEPGSSGVMLTEYVAAAALSRLRGHAASASLGVTVISRGTENHASFAPTAVEQLAAAAHEARTVLACERVAAARALAFGPRLAPHTPLARYFSTSSTVLADRPLTGDLRHAEQQLRLPLRRTGNA